MSQWSHSRVGAKEKDLIKKTSLIVADLEDQHEMLYLRGSQFYLEVTNSHKILLKFYIVILKIFAASKVFHSSIITRNWPGARTSRPPSSGPERVFALSRCNFVIPRSHSEINHAKNEDKVERIKSRHDEVSILEHGAF